MSFPTRSLSTRLPGAGSQNASAGPSPMLVARIAEKKAELEHLKELRDLSAAVAGQMEALEQKLATLSDGTEAIAMVIGNWHNVLRAINMASAQLAKPQGQEPLESEDASLPLPQTLVRIPTEHAPTLQAQAENVTESAENSTIIP
ncbi:DASH complex subunit Dad2 [Colletotrichum higginsianum]|uniref:DASH complex subunit DAD2 n=2 Tax=Colletotrichum higginsianum TaxID=80884 RepID=H1VY92_COLHI|nr:DASH complex subunit Dad2 [Colletotrichum higginsianum IMI 349063]OBR03658.1 DASH complex subunit Dad2 [Colletotrichum higginsianum IMI 349063]CCF45204.1 DASH complex subunit Dad2 [Colletotrichum higginsianum]